MPLWHKVYAVTVCDKEKYSMKIFTQLQFIHSVLEANLFVACQPQYLITCLVR